MKDPCVEILIVQQQGQVIGAKNNNTRVTLSLKHVLHPKEKHASCLVMIYTTDEQPPQLLLAIFKCFYHLVYPAGIVTPI